MWNELVQYWNIIDNLSLSCCFVIHGENMLSWFVFRMIAADLVLVQLTLNCNVWSLFQRCDNVSKDWFLKKIFLQLYECYVTDTFSL